MAIKIGGTTVIDDSRNITDNIGTIPASKISGSIPISNLSTATTQAESDSSTKIATTAYVTNKITTLIGGAPSTLNDLNELAAAINDDANYNSTLTTALATKLPLAGGTITGDTSITNARLTITDNTDALQLYSTTNGAGVNIKMSDAAAQAQSGTIKYVHQDGSSYGSGNAFIVQSSETSMTFLADGKLMYKEGIYSKPATGTGAGTRKDANWDTAYTTANAALPKAGGTVTGILTVNSRINTGEVNTGNNQHLVLNAGETRSYATGQTGEQVYMNAEGGVQISSSPDNWASGWAGRNTTTICNSNGDSSFGGNITVTGNITGVSDLYVADQIIHTGDTDTYMQFHAADQWRVVTGGTERLEVNNNNMHVAATLSMNGHQIDMNNNDIIGVDQIVHEGDSNTYMQFHAADQWRVVTGGVERLEVNNTQITSAEPIHAPSFHGDGSALTGIAGIPTGVIVMWSGQTSAIPSGWALCNGSNGTPNLTDRFVMGAGTSNETTTGGANSRTLSVANLPSHTHTISSIGSLAYPQNGGNQGNQAGYGRGGSLTTNATGSGTAFDNRPSYMALAYIMKT